MTLVGKSPALLGSKEGTEAGRGGFDGLVFFGVFWEPALIRASDRGGLLSGNQVAWALAGGRRTGVCAWVSLSCSLETLQP